MRVLITALSSALLSTALALPALAADEPAAAGLSLEERIGTLESGLGRLAQRSDDWSGTLRYRWQAERRRGSLVRDERLGQLVELELGYSHRLTDELALGLRLSLTEAVGSGIDPFWALGSAAAPPSRRSAVLDRAFLQYSAD